MFYWLTNCAIFDKRLNDKYLQTTRFNKLTIDCFTFNTQNEYLYVSTQDKTAAKQFKCTIRNKNVPFHVLDLLAISPIKTKQIFVLEFQLGIALYKTHLKDTKKKTNCLFIDICYVRLINKRIRRRRLGKSTQGQPIN